MRRDSIISHDRNDPIKSQVDPLSLLSLEFLRITKLAIFPSIFFISIRIFVVL